MAFGPIMKMDIGDLKIELAPITKGSVAVFVEGMQRASVTRYISIPSALTIEDEEEWYEKTRKDPTCIVWGIWDITSERKLIGNTALNSFERDPLFQAVSGVVITDQSYWGKGIASAIHKARTWYAFSELGIVRIKSAVIHGNQASKKALQKSGYNDVYVERNTHYGDGHLYHQDNLECLNPLDWAWERWWGNDAPTPSALASRHVTKSAMEWAEANVIIV